ncbi:MAG TPA: single-stranded DNA-binding protein [Microbacteriaceae bacterium]|nr:single-stranded DNA-binding protein [Microbacteriaceae bacterium]
MSDIIAVNGVIATDPRNVYKEKEEGGLNITSFRLASQQRRYDRAQSKWVDGDTNWYSVIAFRALSENAGASLKKGDRVIVRGRLRMRDWTNGERTGMTVEIEADAIGHDLAWGRTEYRKVIRTASSGESATDEAPDSEAAAESASVEPALAGSTATPF